MKLTPHSTENDLAGVTEIIRHLADADLFNKRLAELRAMAATAESKIADAKSLAEKYMMADKMVADATAKLADHKRREDELYGRESQAGVREAALRKAQMEHDATVAKHAEEMSVRSQAIAHHESNVAAKHNALSRKEAELQERSAIVAGHEKRLKDFARSLGE